MTLICDAKIGTREFHVSQSTVPPEAAQATTPTRADETGVQVAQQQLDEKQLPQKN